MSNFKQIGRFVTPSNSDISKFKIALPLIMANEVKNHFLEGFRKEGGQTEKSRGGWKKRKDRGKKSAGRAILVDTSQMKRDIDKRKTTFERIVVGGQDVEYLQYHNNGTDKLPQREVIGESKVLEKKLENHITRQLKNVLKFK